jgi:hypothetical protein
MYATALALLLFFLTWAVVAAKPWTTPAADPRLKALALREAGLRREAKVVNAIVQRRYAAYHRRLAARRAAIARAEAAPPPSAPAVRVVSLPPITVTRTS